MTTNRSIFDQLERTDQRSKKSNESSFDYYNFSGRIGVQQMRSLIENWYQEFPDDGKNDIRGRIRSRNETGFVSAFFELYLYQILCRSGFAVDIYPEMIQHTRTAHPDFLASRYGMSFYLEATLAQDSHRARAEERRLDELKDAINMLRCPDFSLWFDYSGAATDNIPLKQVRKRIQTWLDGLTLEHVASIMRDQGTDKLPSLPLEYCGLKFKITAYPLSPDGRAITKRRPLGIVMPEELAEWDTKDNIRGAVTTKAKKYGKLGLPFLIGINVTRELFEFEDVLDAIFGDRMVELWRGPQGVTDRRLVSSGNGAWVGRTPRNTHVSGIVVAHSLLPRTVAVETPLLIHNPWAEKPFPAELWKLPQVTFDLQTGGRHDHSGLLGRELLGIPEHWPTVEKIKVNQQ